MEITQVRITLADGGKESPYGRLLARASLKLDGRAIPGLRLFAGTDGPFVVWPPGHFATHRVRLTVAGAVVAAWREAVDVRVGEGVGNG
jgi:DNA-binding cell septation regulator SpoVG